MEDLLLTSAAGDVEDDASSRMANSNDNSKTSLSSPPPFDNISNHDTNIDNLLSFNQSEMDELNNISSLLDLNLGDMDMNIDLLSPKVSSEPQETLHEDVARATHESSADVDEKVTPIVDTSAGKPAARVAATGSPARSAVNPLMLQTVVLEDSKNYSSDPHRFSAPNAEISSSWATTSPGSTKTSLSFGFGGLSSFEVESTGKSENDGEDEKTQVVQMAPYVSARAPGSPESPGLSRYSSTGSRSAADSDSDVLSNHGLFEESGTISADDYSFLPPSPVQGSSYKGLPEKGGRKRLSPLSKHEKKHIASTMSLQTTAQVSERLGDFYETNDSLSHHQQLEKLASARADRRADLCKVDFKEMHFAGEPGTAASKFSATTSRAFSFLSSASGDGFRGRRADSHGKGDGYMFYFKDKNTSKRGEVLDRATLRVVQSACSNPHASGRILQVVLRPDVSADVVKEVFTTLVLSQGFVVSNREGNSVIAERNSGAYKFVSAHMGVASTKQRAIWVCVVCGDDERSVSDLFEMMRSGLVDAGVTLGALLADAEELTFDSPMYAASMVVEPDAGYAEDLEIEFRDEMNSELSAFASPLEKHARGEEWKLAQVISILKPMYSACGIDFPSLIRAPTLASFPLPPIALEPPAGPEKPLSSYQCVVVEKDNRLKRRLAWKCKQEAQARKARKHQEVSARTKVCADNGAVIITTLACSEPASASKESIELVRRFGLDPTSSRGLTKQHVVLCAVTCLHNKRMGKLYVTFNAMYFYGSFLGMKLRVVSSFEDIASLQRSRGILGITDGIAVFEKSSNRGVTDEKFFSLPGGGDCERVYELLTRILQLKESENQLNEDAVGGEGAASSRFGAQSQFMSNLTEVERTIETMTAAPAKGNATTSDSLL